MTARLAGLARAAMRAAIALLPAPLRPWGEAMRAEGEAIDGAAPALRFALGCLGFALREALRFHLLHPLGLGGAAGGESHEGEMTEMDLQANFLARPRRVAAACAVAATGLGLAYMAAAGAPLAFLAINLGALLIGFVLLAIARLLQRSDRATAGAASLAAGAALLLTAMLGATVDGAARWLVIGPLFVQTSLVLLPVMTIGFARRADGLSTAGIVAAAAALALQPDRAMAGALLAGLAALALTRRQPATLIALGAAAIGFAVALVRPDELPAVPYVDRILYTAFAVSPLAGAAVLGGVALLLLPALVGVRHDRGGREAHLVFGAVWLAIVAAAALGNYPTPLVGYGGSAIIGYVLGLLALPGGAASHADPAELAPAADDGPRPERGRPDLREVPA